MTTEIKSVRIVGDGILVEFTDGLATFFSSAFLEHQRDSGTHPIFLSYDPSPLTEQPTIPSLPAKLSLPC